MSKDHAAIDEQIKRVLNMQELSEDETKVEKFSPRKKVFLICSWMVLNEEVSNFKQINIKLLLKSFFDVDLICTPFAFQVILKWFWCSLENKILTCLKFDTSGGEPRPTKYQFD